MLDSKPTNKSIDVQIFMKIVNKPGLKKGLLTIYIIHSFKVVPRITYVEAKMYAE